MNIFKVRLCVVDFTMMDSTVCDGAMKCALAIAYIGMSFSDAHSSHCCNCADKAIGLEMVLRQSNFDQGEDVKMLQKSSNHASHNCLTQALMMLTFKIISKSKSDSHFEIQCAVQIESWFDY